jgi:metal-dependent amidase/aminoacylase/carboxypeptidase family protein
MSFILKALQISSYVLVTFMASWCVGQSTNQPNSIHENIQQRTDIIYDSLVKIRRELHQYPEIAGHERRTSQFIKEYLLNLGLDVKENIGGYGVVGILNRGKKGKKVAWRADIDALASDIPESVPFASRNEGARHICGHDVHTTIALGIANVLASEKTNIDGPVYFIFQPSEENYSGARAMISDGLLDVISPDEIYAAHISPIPSGLVATKSDYLFADYKQINISYKNSAQSEAIFEFTKRMVSNLQNVAPESGFWDTRNLMDPTIGIGNPNTIFKDYVTVQEDFGMEQKNGTLTISAFLSASGKQKIDSIPQLLGQQIQQSKYADQLIDISYSSNKFAFSTERANIQNDATLTAHAIKTISGIYGGSGAIPLYGVIPDGRGDDFAYFQEQIPGTYFLLGGSNFDQGIIAMPHAPNFAVDESCIKTGVNYFSSIIIERINNNK